MAPVTADRTPIVLNNEKRLPVAAGSQERKAITMPSTTERRIPDLTPFEGKVRDRDPETSWNAAAINPDDWSELQSEVVDILRDRGPLTDEAIYREYVARRRHHALKPRREQRVRTARKELQLGGFVTVSKLPGRTASGRNATVWKLTEKGMQ